MQANPSGNPSECYALSRDSAACPNRSPPSRPRARRGFSRVGRENLKNGIPARIETAAAWNNSTPLSSALTGARA
jgi:hypothetical protein